MGILNEMMARLAKRMTGLRIAALAVVLAGGLTTAPAATAAEAKKANQLTLESVYEDYRPDFVDPHLHSRLRLQYPPRKEMKTSTERAFFSRTFVNTSDRADALVEAGLEAEEAGKYRQALDLYQQVIDRYPDTLYRISRYGIYVPVSRYCQLRILHFPEPHVRFYRDKHDGRARDYFNSAQAKYSLEGLAYVRDNMLCTSYGARAMLVLGDAALDTGHYLAALEYFRSVKDDFPDKHVQTPRLDLKIAYCRKMLREDVDLALAARPENDERASKQLDAFLRFAKQETPEKPGRFLQKTSPRCVTADDYGYMLPTDDPFALKEPVWSVPKSGGGLTVDTQPVVTERSVIYRHLNRVYCRSILNGELRWVNDMGGRVSWESRYKHRREDVLVQDGLVFTAMYKNGPTLVALDQTTGQLRWSYGPMSAATAEQAFMRFMTAPAGGPGTVYAGYILDNMMTGAHIDTEYGIIALESATGRIKWRRPICRLQPGKFKSLDFVQGTRIRIRSFASPPIYHQGTVYHCSNAGAMAALDALSGRVKWLTKYPYYSHPDDIHDATRGFGRRGPGSARPAGDGLWINQRPLVVGDALYVLPVNSRYIFKVDRRSGKVLWTQVRPDFTATRFNRQIVHFLGPIRSGELLFVCSSREYRWDVAKMKGLHHTARPGPVCLMDPDNGKIVYWSGGPPLETKQPSIYLDLKIQATLPGLDVWHPRTLSLNEQSFYATARPFLTSDDRLYVSGVVQGGMFVYGEARYLGVMDLKKRAFSGRWRRHLSGEMIRKASNAITLAPIMLKNLLALPRHARENKRTKQLIKQARLLASDTVPENEHPPFRPFSRVTFEKYGTTFELRVSPDRLSMAYDRDHVARVVRQRTDPTSTFAAAELAVADERTGDAARLMKSCLERMSPEDVGFRALVNAQLFRVYRELVRSGIRMRDTGRELENVLGMSRSCTSLADEIETLFAVADVYERKQDYAKAALCLRSLIRVYGGYRYGVSSLYTRDPRAIREAMQDIARRSEFLVDGTRYGGFLKQNIRMMADSLALYRSAVSPVEKDLHMRCEQAAASRLLALQAASPEFRTAFEKRATAAISGKSSAEQIARIAEFPGTKAGERALAALLGEAEADLRQAGADGAKASRLRQRLWRLTDIAVVCDFDLPAKYRESLLAPPTNPAAPLNGPLRDRELNMEEERGTDGLVLERRGELEVRPEVLFLGGRVRKRLDNKFLLYALDTRSGKTIWKATERRGGAGADEIRLRGSGQEAGFTEAFVHRDTVVVHGLFDVLAFSLADGTLTWRYRVPLNFEIQHALKTGDLLVLAGETETLALYLGTHDPNGEVVWQKREQGDIYHRPYAHRDRLVSVRKMPFNVTVRYRSTGRLIGRLDLDDLMLRDDHPIVKKGPREYPVAHDGRYLALCGAGYYRLLDIVEMKTVWKRLMDEDADTPVRMALDGDYLAVTKRDYDVEAIYMLSRRTGQVLWRTDPKRRGSRVPVYSMFIQNGTLYGIREFPGQGYYVTATDCKTGKDGFTPALQEGYESDPEVHLRRRLYGDTLVVQTRDRQDFEIIALDGKTGQRIHTVKVKGTGDFGVHGRASATVQNGTLVLHGKNTVRIAAPRQPKGTRR
jgi:outer membrane protein assembly factor BamB